MNQPDFSTWERGNLVNIALEMYLKLQRQDDEIQQLKRDVKDAIKAYREIVVMYNEDTNSNIEGK